MPRVHFRGSCPSGGATRIEIAVVAYGMYRLLLLLHGTRAVQMLIGIVVLVLTYALAWIFKFTMITYLLGVLFTYGAFAALRDLPAGAARTRSRAWGSRG